MQLEDSAAQSLQLEETRIKLMRANQLRKEDSDATKIQNESLANEIKVYGQTVADLKAQLEELKQQNSSL